MHDDDPTKFRAPASSSKHRALIEPSSRVTCSEAGQVGETPREANGGLAAIATEIMVATSSRMWFFSSGRPRWVLHHSEGLLHKYQWRLTELRLLIEEEAKPQAERMAEVSFSCPNALREQLEGEWSRTGLAIKRL